MPFFETDADYERPLLQVLAGLPGGRGAARDVLDVFWQRFWSSIPPEHQARLDDSREPVWHSIVVRARNALEVRGLANAPRHGIWGITEDGRRWLADRTGALAVPSAPPQRNTAEAGSDFLEPVMPMHETQPPTLDRVVVFTIAGKRFSRTGRQALEQARRAMVGGLPEEAHNYIAWAVEIDGQLVGVKWLFGLITGLSPAVFQTNQVRPILERLGLAVRHIETRANAPSPEGPAPPRPPQRPESVWNASRGPVAIYDTQISAIRDFLSGRASRPSDEVLCDWVHFCYNFELYREGRDLFGLVDPTQVNDWYYERTRRLARVCSMKMAGQA